MAGLTEVGVPTYQDPLETGTATEGDGAIQIAGRRLAVGCVAATIDQVQRFGGVGQRNQKGMISLYTSFPFC